MRLSTVSLCRSSIFGICELIVGLSCSRSKRVINTLLPGIKLFACDCSCHIPYLTSNTSSPTPTFRTYLRPLLRRYFNSSSPDPFRCYATIIIVSLHFYFLLLSPIVPCPLLSPIVSIPHCI